MQKARMLGNCVEYLAKKKEISNEELCTVLQCDQASLRSFLKGRHIASFSQLELLATVLEVSVAQLLKGDVEHYEKSVVHCMNQFSDPENREKILDLIDDYLDVFNALQANLSIKE